MPAAKQKASARKTSTLPANIQEQLEREAAAIQDRIAAPSGDRVRMQAGRGFTAPDGSEGESLEVVVIDFVSANLFYDGPYDRDNPQPPECFAIGPEPSMLIPSANSPDVQAEACATCPMNQFGSKGKGKACKNTRLLALIPAATLGEDDSPIWVMSVPPTSIKSFDGYASALSTKHKTIPLGMVTEVTLDEKSDFVAPRFRAVRPLDADELTEVMERRDEARKRLLAEPDTTQAKVADKPANTRRGGKRR